MSIRIKLHFREFANPELAQKGIELVSIRLMAWVKFKNQGSLPWHYEAIVDTGAPASLVPLRIWQRASCEIKADSIVRGVVPKEECVLPVSIGTVFISLLDEEAESDFIPVLAHLAYTDEIPLVIGFKGVLEKAKLQLDYLHKEAWLEFYR